jgi:hypothetical protein
MPRFAGLMYVFQYQINKEASMLSCVLRPHQFKVRRKEKNKNKNVASGISDQQEENSMIFPRLPLL